MQRECQYIDLAETGIRGGGSHFTTSCQTWLKVADAMSKDVATISSDQTVLSAAKVMTDKNISCILVKDNGNITGIVTETDLLKRTVIEARDLQNTKISEIMSSPVESVSPNLSVLDASEIMDKKGIKRLPIFEDDRLVGIVTQTDLIRVLMPYGIWIDISAIMSRDTLGIQKHATVTEAAKIMAARNVSSVVIMDDNNVVGIFTERDLFKRVIAQAIHPDRICVGEVMSSPVVIITPDTSVFSASVAMEKLHIRKLVVMEDKQLYGVLSQTDIFWAVKQKFREEEEKNHQLLESSKSNIYTLLLDGRITYVNPSFINLLGVSDPLQLVGKNFLPEQFWVNPEDGENFLRELQHETIQARELNLKDSKGRRVYVTFFSNFTKDVHGKINGIQGVLQDMTAKKELIALREAEHSLQISKQLLKISNEKLREERNFSQSIIETAQAIILVLDTDGNILSFNPYMEEICDYALEEVKGKSWIETFVPQRDRPWIQKLLDKAAGDIQTRGNVNPIVTKNGLEVEIKWYDKALKDINGNIIGLLSIGQDVTEEKEYEEKLKSSKIEAESANKAKSQFLANMSHEIRTPMNAIMGFSDLLADGDLTAEQKQAVNIIRESSYSLLTLINDILDFSKIESRQLNVEIIDCSLARLLNSVVSLMRLKATEKGLEFELVESSGLPTQIHTDPTRLNQCLVNLIDNPIKFTKKGRVYVKVSLENKDNQPYIRFDVGDTGIGIPKEKEEKIFESFTQADGDTTRKYGGTGLGLTITKQLAYLLGGELTLTSEVDKGSVFSMTIPANVDVTKQQLLYIDNITNNTDTCQTEADQPEFSGNILVAEDAPTSQVLIKLLLERLGLRVTIAEDGNEALQKVLTHQFDLIFMDMMMPNMDGCEAARAIKNAEITTPIVALTANAMKGDDKKCFDAGCDDYLTKPINHKKLLNVLSKYLPSKEIASLEAVGSAKS